MDARGGVSSHKVKECDFGLGLRMQPKDSCLIMSPSSSSTSSFSGGNNRVGRFGDIYDVVGSAATKPLQFSSGEIAQSVNREVAFTVAQWQELERQNLICRYLMASVPVPPELLIPILRTQSSTSNVSKGSSLEFGIFGSGSDAEPWRCKRTDGKKWRCSRDVAPDQKYCERHSHKSRPRSRKPVELHTESTNLLNQKPQFRSQTNPNFSIFGSSTLVSLPTSYEQQQPRNLEWFLKGETAPVAGGFSNSNQKLQSMKTEHTKFDEKMYPFEPNSYMGLSGDSCSLLLSPKPVSLSPSETQTQETRHFLDVWSSALRGNSEVNGIGDEKTLFPSSLSLSIEGIEDGESGGYGSRPSSQWMSHSSWSGSTPGGPLAEALCLGISSSAKDDSSYGDNKT